MNAYQETMPQSNKVLTAVDKCLAGLPAGAVGVVAVSGGPDSVGLLRALLMATSGPLVVSHLNHLLRGDESDGDEAFVRDFHQRLLASGAYLLPLQCRRLDVRAAAGKENLESAARRLRYEWLAAVARETDAVWVATGHTADDQAETVLHRLLRGSGLRGLAGIPRRRELAPGIALIRPLLDVRRHEILSFLQGIDQPFRTDSSNRDRQYTRTRLRHDLLPLLTAQYNPATVEVLCHLAEQAGEVEGFIRQQALKLLTDAERPRAGAMIVLEADRLVAASPVVMREALRLIWNRGDWPLGEMGFEDWQRAAAVVCGDLPAVDLPGGVHIRRMENVVQVQWVGFPA
jgi:tRNA(Ile)-lysidine synthase